MKHQPSLAASSTAPATAPTTLPGKAPLANVGLALGALSGAMGRPSHLPGIVVLYGPSGLGKTTAATMAITQLRAYYVEARSSWTRKAMYMAVLKDMGIMPAKTVYAMEEQVLGQLAASQRPLIIDQCDYLVAKGIADVIQDIYEGSNAALMLVGEEHLPSGLERWERLHNRVLEWVPAQFADMDDARALRELYCDRVQIADDLLTHIHARSRGVVRRICVNLERVQQGALASGKRDIDRAAWGNQPLYTGEAPKRRA